MLTSGPIRPITSPLSKFETTTPAAEPKPELKLHLLRMRVTHRTASNTMKILMTKRLPPKRPSNGHVSGDGCNRKP